MNKFVAILVTAAVAISGSVAGISIADAAPKAKVPTGIVLPPSKNYGSVKTGYKPKTISYTVDGGARIINIFWKSWGPKKAVGYGVFRTNNCKPNCAETTSVHYLDVTVKASQPKGNKFRVLSVEASYYGDTGVTLNK